MSLHLERIPPDLRADLVRRMPGLEVLPSPLVRVIGIGQVMKRAGITVELLALEVREQGAVIHWRARSDTDLPAARPEVEVTDPVGTSFRVSSGWGSDGGRPCWVGETVIVPAPQPRGSLSIAIPRFGAPPAPATEPGVEGPWSFVIELPGEPPDAADQANR